MQITVFICALCRGSKAVSRLASYFPERFVAYAWLDVGHMPPPKHTTNTHEFAQWLSKVEAENNAKLWGYWAFFCSEDAPEIIASHVSHGCSALPMMSVEGTCMF